MALLFIMQFGIAIGVIVLSPSQELSVFLVGWQALPVGAARLAGPVSFTSRPLTRAGASGRVSLSPLQTS